MTDEWTSGVGGAQCGSCGRTTIVRGFGDDMLGEPTEYLCKPCWTGTDDEDDVECTCDQLAHPCEVHDCRGGAPDEVRGPDWTPPLETVRALGVVIDHAKARRAAGETR